MTTREINSKIEYCMPYKKGTSKYENIMGMLKDILADNPDCPIIECEECVECGVINDSVQETDGRKLCDYCIRDLEGKG